VRFFNFFGFLKKLLKTAGKRTQRKRVRKSVKEEGKSCSLKDNVLQDYPVARLSSVACKWVFLGVQINHAVL